MPRTVIPAVLISCVLLCINGYGNNGSNADPVVGQRIDPAAEQAACDSQQLTANARILANGWS